jgi:hypothetical protein
MKTFKQFDEGVNDPGIFKAFFTAGGPGSGKSHVARQSGVGSISGGSFGLKIIDSDPAFKLLLKQAGMTAKPKDIFSPAGQVQRDRAKTLTKKQQGHYLDGRLGLLIDGTGKDYPKIKKMSDALRILGYDTYMLFVNTSLDVAIQRDLARDRTLGAAEITPMWKAVQQNMGKFQSYFGRENFILVDNNSANDDVFNMIHVQIEKLIKKLPTNRAATAWIKSQRSR